MFESLYHPETLNPSEHRKSLSHSNESCSAPTGKMFKSLDLSLIVEFMLMFYKDKPIDWLLDHIMWVKVCNPEKDAVRLSHTRHEHNQRSLTSFSTLFVFTSVFL